MADLGELSSYESPDELGEIMETSCPSCGGEIDRGEFECEDICSECYWEAFEEPK